MSILRSAAILILAMSAACGPTDDPGEPDAIHGIWSADVHNKTVNGAPLFFKAVEAFRMDPEGGGLLCHRQGISAEVCEFDGSAESFELETTTVTDYGSFILTTHNEFVGESWADGGHLETTYIKTYDYDMADGETYRYVLEGEATLYQVEALDEAPSKGMTLLGEFGDFEAEASRHLAHIETPYGEQEEKGAAGESRSANVRVRGDYAYMARFHEGLTILDISDPSAIVPVASAHPEAVGAYYYNDIKLFEVGERLYAACSDSRIGLVVYEVTDPTRPTFVSSFFPELAEEGDRLNNHTVYMVGTTAYLGNYGGSKALDPAEGESGGLLIVDLSDPANPQELGRWLARELGGSIVHDLYVSEDGVAYLASWEIGLVILDVSNPGAPTLLGQFTYDRMTSHSVWVTEVNGQRVAVHGDEDFGSHIRIVDVDPASPTFLEQIGAYQLRPEVSVHNIMAIGDTVYAAWYQDGVRVLDISDPTDPQISAWYNTWPGYPSPGYGMSFYEGGIGVDVVGDRVYLADIQRGLMIFELEGED